MGFQFGRYCVRKMGSTSNRRLFDVDLDLIRRSGLGYIYDDISESDKAEP